MLGIAKYPELRRILMVIVALVLLLAIILMAGVKRTKAKHVQKIYSPVLTGETILTANLCNSAKQNSYALLTTPEMEQEEKDKQEEIVRAFEHKVRASGSFREDRLTDLIKIVRQHSVPFSRVNTRAVFEGKEVLSVDEKRQLGLNTRIKYTKEFIAFCIPEKFAEAEPKKLLENMHLAAFHEISRKRLLADFKRKGFVKRVEVLTCGDSRDCLQIAKLQRIYLIDKAPILPLTGCDAPYCRCSYLALIN